MKTFNDLRSDLIQEDPELFISLEIVGKLIAARDRKSISQRELSKISGIPQKTISRIENGIDIPKILTLLKLTKALGLELALIDKETKNELSASLAN
ncbi:helix-turn-helix domain-containing protein [Sutcliffiella rhizosphaerae]|uniref:HTH cro/C1-type domain-containing protein n=1 Tax=Sutcliffiella rhizosphaerae TaxID=2880967 RepID=A0ABM8YS19_9BACI|nr:helix-turn-helix transcriptional regulator [Sutcliffiella rhizosphaerae]CAG9622795.1 hypothetical protein BACCIP111883_03586 [Sutcliffiella rhizosphaerae]